MKGKKNSKIGRPPKSKKGKTHKICVSLSPEAWKEVEKQGDHKRSAFISKCIEEIKIWGFMPKPTLMLLGVLLLSGCGSESAPVLSEETPQTRIAVASPQPVEITATEVTYLTSFDGSEEKALYYGAKSESARPLVLDLHSWGSNYKQWSLLKSLSIAEDFHYIHPNFRGPNKTTMNCLSDAVISDLEDAIRYAKAHGNVDDRNIFIVGASGGGYAALGAFMKLQIPVNAFIAWVPVTDLESYYQTAKVKRTTADQEILNCTTVDGTYNPEAMQARSPLSMPLPNNGSRVEIYAGINDGHGGDPVPISHSIRFYNKLAEAAGEPLVSEEQAEALLNRTAPLIEGVTIEERGVYFQTSFAYASLTIFDGGHEILGNHTMDRIKELVR
jgi:pimeloyl-ACP methyl ester carboxylesterase